MVEDWGKSNHQMRDGDFSSNLENIQENKLMYEQHQQKITFGKYRLLKQFLTLKHKKSLQFSVGKLPQKPENLTFYRWNNLYKYVYKLNSFLI